jgi:hypothetical protein
VRDPGQRRGCDQAGDGNPGLPDAEREAAAVLGKREQDEAPAGRCRARARGSREHEERDEERERGGDRDQREHRRRESADEQRLLLAETIGGHARRVGAGDAPERKARDDDAGHERREAEIELDVAGQREHALVDQGDAELHADREPENRPG